ncbi:MAG: hypothetical protein JO228_15655 [Xanthobacteraceae bacterium]|nr:hypothetical protein [Xanthobacteraceae bacterium]
MRFILGLILGAVLTAGVAFIHDKYEPGVAKPLVNWTNAAELQKAAFQYVRVQAENLFRWATGKRES